MGALGRTLAVVCIAIAVAGCSTPLTTREKGAIAGGGIGAGAGAAVGSAAGSTATGALIGVGVGAVSGGLIGDAIQSAEQRPAPPPVTPPPPPAPPVSAPPPPPTRVVVASPPPVMIPSPQYIWVPKWGVYVLDGHDIAYHEGYHYYYYEAHWYVARSYTGPWAIVAAPPPALATVPPGHFHRRLPPGLAKKGKSPPGHRHYD